MRILHTSDWHIGRQFHNVSLLEDQRHVLKQLFSIIEQENIDVVLIAGDIYDRSVPPAEAVALLDEVIDHISHQLKRPLIIISGNHDSAQRLAFGARQLAKSAVHIIGQLEKELQPVILNDEHGEVAFYGIPYADPASVRNVFGGEQCCEIHSHEDAMEVLTNQIKEHNTLNRRTVVLSHCFIDGGEPSESERPLSVGGADKVPYRLFSDFQYAALGHLHGPQYKGKEFIRYSGSILKYSFSEVNHNKSITVVDMDANGKCTVEKIPLKPLRDMRIIEGKLDDIIANAKNDPNPEDYLLIRLLDKHALYEPMAKLREVYPNILQLEKPNLNQAGERQLLKRENLKKGELPMFLDFYQQMTDEELDVDAIKIISDSLDSIHKGEG
jgi:exonuclease SbcD